MNGLLNAKWILAAMVSIMSLGILAFADDDVKPRSIAKGGFTGLKGDGPRCVVIRSEPDWKALWIEHRRGEKLAQPPEIDFAKEMVLVVTGGPKRTGGHSIEIKRLEIQDGKMVAHYALKSPKPGAMTMQVLTHPFHMVAVPLREGKVEFVEDQPAPQRALPAEK